MDNLVKNETGTDFNDQSLLNKIEQIKKKHIKFVIISGGVLSGLGKGIASASIGALLSGTHKVVPIKADGYLNIDPGTMNPIEHGEVFVLDDGGEVDMDFGHYERFLGIHAKSEWNLTMGKVYKGILDKERKGDFLGKTVQLIPHVTDYIKNWIYTIALKEQAEIMLIEIGGTVGDMENELYIEAMRQIKNDIGQDNTFYITLTYVPIPYGVKELKSKPTQQCIKLLNEHGIWPDMIIGRCEEILTETVRQKIANFCNVVKESVISGVDLDSVYKIPLNYHEQNVEKIIGKKFNLNFKPNLTKWQKYVNILDKNTKNSHKTVTIGICGKYTRLEDSYASIVEALQHCSAHLDCKVNIHWLETTDVESEDFPMDELQNTDGIIVPGGFGIRGTEGKIKVVKCSRINKIPFLGICFGLHMAIIEYARHVCDLANANSTEIDENTPHPVIKYLPNQSDNINKGGTMRLGAYTADIKKDTLLYQLYNSTKIIERHRHRYEVNPEYHANFTNTDLVFSGSSDNGRLIEFIELKNHPYFVGTQAHPELKSTLLNPAPLFYGLVNSALKRKYGK